MANRYDIFSVNGLETQFGVHFLAVSIGQITYFVRFVTLLLFHPNFFYYYIF